MSEDNKILNDLNTAFEEFKSTNDARLNEIEKKGSADTLIETKTAAINEELTKLQKKLEEVEKKANRPAVADRADEDMEYRTAFSKWARKGTVTEELETRAMSGGTSADGGYAVPTIIDSAISAKAKLISPMRSLAKVISGKSPNFNHLVNIHNTGMSGWVAETAARTATNTPQFANIPIPNGEVYANAAISQWLLDGDSVVDVEQLISDELGLEFAQAEGAAFVSGNGTNKPSGFLNNTPTTSGSDTVLQYVPTGQAAALAADPLISLVYKLASPYRANAKFVMNANTQAAVRLLKDTTNNYLWAPGLNGGQGKLLGYDVVEMPDMADVAAASFSIAFGDFSQGYLIMDRRDTIVLRDPYTAKPNVLFYAIKRVGGQLVLPEAIKVLKTSVS